MEEDVTIPDYSLNQQRLMRTNQEKEIERLRQQEIDTAAQELKRQEIEKIKKRELVSSLQRLELLKNLNILRNAREKKIFAEEKKKENRRNFS